MIRAVTVSLSLSKKNPVRYCPLDVIIYFLITDCFQTDKNARANKNVLAVVVEHTRGICLNQIAGRHLHSEGNCWEMSRRINRF